MEPLVVSQPREIGIPTDLLDGIAAADGTRQEVESSLTAMADFPGGGDAELLRWRGLRESHRAGSRRGFRAVPTFGQHEDLARSQVEVVGRLGQPLVHQLEGTRVGLRRIGSPAGDQPVAVGQAVPGPEVVRPQLDRALEGAHCLVVEAAIEEHVPRLL